MEILTILIADDHPLFRKGLRALLGDMPAFQLIGEATTGAEAVIKAEQLQPDVVLMDLQMPEGGGLSAIRQIRAHSPHIRVLVITMFADDSSVFAAMQAGARGYVLKDADDEAIATAILRVGAGEAIFSPAIAERMIAYFSQGWGMPAEVFPDLTDSERNVLTLMAGGATNGEIAKELSLTLKTVRNYLSNIYSKLQVADRTQAVLKARQAGLGESPSE
jgi:DNA-binding NarL/FixJ family response regulator